MHINCSIGYNSQIDKENKEIILRGFRDSVVAVNLSKKRSKDSIIQELILHALDQNYRAVDIDIKKPWGAFVRFDSKDAEHFVENFFPGLDFEKARLGKSDVELSPKFLLVSPGARLSWQRHERRAECWSYLTLGSYHRSINPGDQGELITATPGEIIQLERGECHRLVGAKGNRYTLVAEIWQHTDRNHPSDEDDIERLQDDYSR